MSCVLVLASAASSCLLYWPPSPPPTGLPSPSMTQGPGSGRGPTSWPTRPEHLLSSGTRPSWGLEATADSPRPALNIYAAEGEFHISNYDTICSVWKWEPVDFNSPAVPVFRTVVKISAEQRGEQSEVLMGVLPAATEEQFVTVTWPWGPPCSFPVQCRWDHQARLCWELFPKCHSSLR